MNNKPFNPLDTESLSADDKRNIKAEQQSLWDKHNNLIHQVFEQNPQGKELLALWKETLITVPTVMKNSTQMEVGIAEGKKTVVREIILAIKSVEGK